MMSRQRLCSGHRHAHYGHGCFGSSTESRSCRSRQSCPIDGGWSDWSLWSHCSGTCGRGTMTRQRTCTNPRPAHGGVRCVGTSIETKSCRTHHHCPPLVVVVNGGWSDWSLWSHCSGTCGRGTMTRQRTCTNPSPAHGGASCVGTTVETKSCRTYHHCPRKKLPLPLSFEITTFLED
ncbi:thrombospondin-1-like [Saccostrea cucullata]|uniref:thrombospondin-1-like n=1 Tax=Saccostrea cuccullata TaxID=36930 RepID=UPI002ED14299